MKIFNKGVALALALTLFVSLVVPSFAQDMDPKYLQGEGVVKEAFDNDRLLVEINDMEVALNVGDETMVLDSKTGLMGNLKDLKVGDLIYAYYSPMMTRSLPPQSFATVIITGIEKDKPHAAFFTVKEVIASSNQEVRVLNEDGSLIARISKDTSFTPFKTKQIVTLKDIKVGTELFVWYDVVALSYPGQTNVDKAVFIKQTQETDTNHGIKAVLVPEGSKYTEEISINGKIMDMGTLSWHGQNSHVMVPLRVVAESLGFKVTWDTNIQGAYLDNGIVKTTVNIGKDAYFKASSKAIGLTQNFEFGAKPILLNDRMYVPVELFNLLYGDNTAVKVIK